MAVIAAEHPPERAEFAGRVLPALKDASITALVALGLVVPILALRIDQDINNQPILRGRWHYVAVAVGLAFAARLGYLLIGPWATACALLSAALTYQHTVSPLLGAPWDYLVIAAGWLATGYAARRWLNPPAPEPTAAKPASGGVLPAGFAQVAAIVGIVLLVLYPLAVLALTGRSGAIKWIDNFGIQILIYVMLGWGLNIVVGLAGLLDLGYVAFYAVGAYSTALLSQHFGFSFWLCLPLAGIFAALWGIMLGFPVLRLRGDYLAIVTLAFGEIIRLVLINWVPVTNGYAGISGIPRPSFFGLPFNASDAGFAAVLGLEFSPLHRTIFLFYVILALALLTNWVTLRLRRLPVGRAWEALREDEIACRSLGINTTSTKLTAFAIGAGFGGFAGSFFAARQGFISPESFTFIESAVVVAIVVLGGMGSQLGVAIAAAAMIGGTEVLRELDWLKQVFGPDFDPTQYRMLLFGFGMVAVMIWKPRGLISTRNPSIFLRERRAVGASLVKEGHG